MGNVNTNNKNNKINILVCDDNEVVSKFLENFLKNDGYDVFSVKNGFDAIDYIHQNEVPDLIIMDINMPIMDGRITTQKIKEIYPNVPVVAFTTYNQTLNLSDETRELFVKIINKSENMFLLVETIKKIVEKK